MVTKYQLIRDNTLMFIRNRVFAGIPPDIIAKEILVKKKIPIPGVFKNVPIPKVLEMVEWIVHHAYIVQLKEHYRNIDFKETETERINKFYKKNFKE